MAQFLHYSNDKTKTALSLEYKFVGSTCKWVNLHENSTKKGPPQKEPEARINLTQLDVFLRSAG